jgi:hypothetical protein
MTPKQLEKFECYDVSTRLYKRRFETPIGRVYIPEYFTEKDIVMMFYEHGKEAGIKEGIEEMKKRFRELLGINQEQDE